MTTRVSHSKLGIPISELSQPYNAVRAPTLRLSFPYSMEHAIDAEERYWRRAGPYKARHNFVPLHVIKQMERRPTRRHPDRSRNKVSYDTHRVFDLANLEPEPQHWQLSEAEMALLASRPRRRTIAAEEDRSACSICYEEFGWRAREWNVRRPGISYLNALCTRPDAAKRVLKQRHSRCPPSAGGYPRRCTVCTDCFARDIERQLGSVSSRSRERIASIRCIGCNRGYSDDAVIAKLLAPAQLEAYRAAVLRRYLHTAPDIAFCPQPNCTAVVAVDVKDSRCTLISCPECPMHFCFVCKAPYHWGKTCSEARRSDVSMTWTEGNTKPCPRCHVQIEKNQGCDHMHCSLCGTDFSWSDVGFGIYNPNEGQAMRRVHFPPRKLPINLLHLVGPKAIPGDAISNAQADDSDDDDDVNYDDADIPDVPGDVSVYFGVASRSSRRRHLTSVRDRTHMTARARRRAGDLFGQVLPVTAHASAA